MRTMYDSVNASAIPDTAAMVAGYVSGPYAWHQQDWERFVHARCVHIATSADVDNGEVLDVERTDATPAQVPAWLQKRAEKGVLGSVYCGLDAVPQVLAACVSASVAFPPLWIAHWDNTQELPGFAVAKQYKSTNAWDISVVRNHWPGVDPEESGNATPPSERYFASVSVEVLSAFYRVRSSRLTGLLGQKDQLMAELVKVTSLIRSTYGLS